MYYDVKDERLYMTATWCHSVCCEEHIHTRMEFIVCTEGTVHFRCGGKEFCLEEGCAAFIPPCVPHAFDNRGVCLCCILEFPVTMNPHFSEYLRMHSCPYPITELRPEAMQYLLTLLSPTDIRISRFQDIHAQALLSVLSQEFIAGCIFHPTPKMSGSDDTYLAALTYIDEHIDTPLTLERTAEALNIHPQSLSRIFTRNSSMTFTEAVHFARIRHACSLLNRGSSVSDAAFSSGFSSIRTFNRVFQKTMLCTPTEYLRDRTDGNLHMQNAWIRTETKELYS